MIERKTGIDPMQATRRADVVRCRHVAMLLLRARGFSLLNIARAFAMSDHTTIMNAERKVRYCADLQRLVSVIWEALVEGDWTPERVDIGSSERTMVLAKVRSEVVQMEKRMKRQARDRQIVAMVESAQNYNFHEVGVAHGVSYGTVKNAIDKCAQSR